MKFTIKKVSGADCSDVPGAELLTGFRDVRWPDDKRHWQALRERGVATDSISVIDGRLHSKLPANSWEVEIGTVDELIALQKSISNPLILSGSTLAIYDDHRE